MVGLVTGQTVPYCKVPFRFISLADVLFPKQLILKCTNHCTGQYKDRQLNKHNAQKKHVNHREEDLYQSCHNKKLNESHLLSVQISFKRMFLQ